MRATKTNDVVIADWGDLNAGFAKAAHVAAATYRCPYQSHAPFAPNCAVADVKDGRALVISATQDVYNSRAMLAQVLGLPVDKVRVQYVESSGTFGRSCYEDAAQAAAVMSQVVGRPVRVQFMRWTSTAGTTMARRISPTCAPASMRAAGSSPTNIAAG